MIGFYSEFADRKMMAFCGGLQRFIMGIMSIHENGMLDIENVFDF